MKQAVNCRVVNCRGVNCRGVNCRGVYCRGVNCRGGILSWVKLSQRPLYKNIVKFAKIAIFEFYFKHDKKLCWLRKFAHDKQTLKIT